MELKLRKIEIRENTNEVIRYPEDMYCVYVHKDPETLDVVYVGKGTLHRAFQMTHRGYDHHVWLLEKLEKFEIQEIVEIKGGNMTEQEALIVETHEIKCCLRHGCNLFNVAHNPYRRTRRKHARDNGISGAESGEHSAKMGSEACQGTRDLDQAVSV